MNAWAKKDLFFMQIKEFSVRKKLSYCCLFAYFYRFGCHSTDLNHVFFTRSLINEQVTGKRISLKFKIQLNFFQNSFEVFM